MCDCIKISYIPIGEEPVSIEVISTGLVNEKNYYEFIYDGTTFLIYWDGTKWILSSDGIKLWVLAEDLECPTSEFTNDKDTTYFSGFSAEECTPRRTVTYSKVAEGWSSFWSYQPDWMTEMNSIFYTFKDGELWRQVFNTLSLNSSHPWTADIYTNISAGSIDYTYFVEKENQWYAYIRRFDDTIDVKALSTQGVGLPTTRNIANPSAVLLTFSFNIDSSISIGDSLYKNSGGNLVLVGTITNLSANSITVNTVVGSTPLLTDFLICVKNSQAESFGARGYYMNVYLYNDSIEQVKLFAVGTSVFKSFL